MSGQQAAVLAHYGGEDLVARIRDALAAAGKDDASLTPRDLAPVDEFHSRGRRATEELAELASPPPEARVIDVGAGIGGPARYLAERFGCAVTALELNPAFCRAGRWLTERTGLSDRVSFREGSGTELPFPAGVFDLAWTMQMQMNVPDKERLYAEIHRVLAPGGRLVLQELCQGPGGPCHLPTPWADDGAISHLVAPDDLLAAIEVAGFQRLAWRDTTEEALAWFEAQSARRAEPSALGIHLVLGRDAGAKRINVERNYREGRVRQVLGAFARR